MTIITGPAKLFVPGDDGGWTAFGYSDEVSFRFEPEPVYDGAVFSLRDLRASVSVPLDRVNHDWLALMLPARMWRWHRIRSRCCNPAGNPLPLPKSGYGYQRRRKARQRRKGRR